MNEVLKEVTREQVSEAWGVSILQYKEGEKLYATCNHFGEIDWETCGIISETELLDVKPFKSKSKVIQQLIFYSQTIVGMCISHYVPTSFFLVWVVVSLYLGHLINKKNYGR